jgi:hypothetical protein
MDIDKNRVLALRHGYLNNMIDNSTKINANIKPKLKNKIPPAKPPETTTSESASAPASELAKSAPASAAATTKDQTPPIIKQKHQDLINLLQKLQESTNKENTTKLYNEITEFYVENVCKATDAESGCKIPEKNTEQRSNVRQHMRMLIQRLEHPSMIDHIDRLDKQSSDGKDGKMSLEKIRMLTVTMLKKFNSDQFFDVSEFMYRFFPETYETDFNFFDTVPGRVHKKTDIKIKAHRSELEPNDSDTIDAKFGRTFPEIMVTYPNGLAAAFKGMMLEVENALEANGRQGDGTRDKDIDKPLMTEKITIDEYQYDGSNADGLPGKDNSAKVEDTRNATDAAAAAVTGNGTVTVSSAVSSTVPGNGAVPGAGNSKVNRNDDGSVSDSSTSPGKDNSNFDLAQATAIATPLLLQDQSSGQTSEQLTPDQLTLATEIATGLF